MWGLFIELLSTIKHNLKRYISIIIIIFLGGAFYVGMMSNSLVFQNTMRTYLEKQNYPDIKIYSDIGFTNKDLKKLKKKISSIKTIEGKYYTEATTVLKNDVGEKTDYRVFIHSYSPKYKLNSLEVVEGRKIKAKNECVLSVNFKDAGIKLGDKIKFSSDSLTIDEYKVIGFVNDPQYISKDKGISVLTGEMVSYFAYVSVSDFDKTEDVFVTADISLVNKNDYKDFTDDYEKYVNNNKKKIKSELDKILKVRYNEILSQKKKDLEEAEKEYENQKNNVQNELSNAKAQLSSAERQLANAKLSIMPQSKIDEYLEALNSNVATAKGQLDKVNQVASISKNMIDAVKFVKDSGLVPDDTLSEAYTSLLENIFKKYEDIAEVIGAYDQLVRQFQNEMNAFDCNGLNGNAAQACNSARSSVVAKGVKYNTAAKELEDKTKSLHEEILKAKTLDGLYEVLDDYTNAVNNYANAAAEMYETAVNEYNNLYDQLKNNNANIRRKISAKESELKQAKADYETKEKEAQEKLEKTYNEIIEGKKAIKKGFAYSSIVNARNDSYGHGNYTEDTERINNLAKVFPLLFFIVAFLVTSTSITRLVQEERSKIGILKSLGCNKMQIVLKYAMYALSADIIGIVLGILFGIFVFPVLTTDVYTLMFYVPKIKYVANPVIILVAILLSLVSTVLTGVIVSLNVAKEVPAKLMRKKEVKKSRLTKIERKSKWFRKQSLIKKIAYRNMFTNIIRSIMTIIGIVGCTALIIASFCIRESLSSYIAIQFNKIYDIDTEFYYKNDITQYEIKKDYQKTLKQKTVKNASIGRKEAITITKDRNLKTYVVVPKTLSNFEDSIGLYSTAAKKRISLRNQTGVVITEKLAKMLKIKRGENIAFIDSSNVHHTVVVSDIVENYVYNYIYMDEDIYEDVYDYELTSNYMFIKYTSDTNEKIEDSGIFERGIYANYTSMNIYKDNNSNMVKSLDKIIIIIIIAAGLLAFVVLYNISKISISEKTVEISTLKVLGYKSKWINKYINYEIYILKYIGIFIGIFAGYFLTETIITACETNYMMFYHGVSILNYIYGITLTLIFSWVISYITRKDIKAVDMAKSLKVTEE